jgi:hypothetical protein
MLINNNREIVDGSNIIINSNPLHWIRRFVWLWPIQNLALNMPFAKASYPAHL